MKLATVNCYISKFIISDSLKFEYSVQEFKNKNAEAIVFEKFDLKLLWYSLSISLNFPTKCKFNSFFLITLFSKSRACLASLGKPSRMIPLLSRLRSICFSTSNITTSVATSSPEVICSLIFEFLDARVTSWLPTFRWIQFGILRIACWHTRALLLPGPPAKFNNSNFRRNF